MVKQRPMQISQQISRQISRRRFLKATVLGAILSTLGGKILLTLSQSDQDIFQALFEEIAVEHDQATITKALSTISEFLTHVDSRDLWELKIALRFFEYSPIFSFLKPYSRLSPQDRQFVLKTWQLGAPWKRTIFSAFKELCMLGKYAQPESWKVIGYGRK